MDNNPTIVSTESSKDLQLTKVDTFPERVDGLCKEFSNGFYGIAIKDHKFLNWRFCDSPFKYQKYCLTSNDNLQGYLVYRYGTVNNQKVIQGLISLEVKSDHVYMHLVESAPFNKGKSKVYAGVPGNLVAFACKLSFQRGHEGNVSFHSKTQLVQHYIGSLGAMHAGGRIMIIGTAAALKLINKYFPL